MGKKLKPYQVTCAVTVSLNAQVFARDKKHALKIATDLGMPSIYENKRYRSPGESDDEWRTSGELDGEPTDIEASEQDEEEYGD